jgi:hypothetical protein
MLDSSSCFEGHGARRRCRCQVILQIILPMLIAFGAASAQDSTATRSSGWLIGGSVAVPGASTEAFYPLTMVGVRATQLRPGRPGVDLELMTAPYPFALGIANLVGRAGVALPLRVMPGVLLLPAAGVTAAGAASVSEEGAGALFGLNAGMSVLLTGSGSSGLRAGITWHHFGESDEPVWMMELGWGTLH